MANNGYLFICKCFAVHENGDILQFYNLSKGDDDFYNKAFFSPNYFGWDSAVNQVSMTNKDKILENMRSFGSQTKKDYNSETLFSYFADHHFEVPGITKIIYEVIGYSDAKNGDELYRLLNNIYTWPSLVEGCNLSKVCAEYHLEKEFAEKYLQKAVLHKTNSFRIRCVYYVYRKKAEYEAEFDEGAEVVDYSFTTPTISRTKRASKTKKTGTKVEYKKNVSALYKAKVKFTDGKSYYYNSKYYVEIGNKVKVSGSRSAMIGEVTEVTAAPSKAAFMQDIVEIINK